MSSKVPVVSFALRSSSIPVCSSVCLCPSQSPSAWHTDGESAVPTDEQPDRNRWTEVGTTQTPESSIPTSTTRTVLLFKRLASFFNCAHPSLLERGSFCAGPASGLKLVLRGPCSSRTADSMVRKCSRNGADNCDSFSRFFTFECVFLFVPLFAKCSQH